MQYKRDSSDAPHLYVDTSTHLQGHRVKKILLAPGGGNVRLHSERHLSYITTIEGAVFGGGVLFCVSTEMKNTIQEVQLQKPIYVFKLQLCYHSSNCSVVKISSKTAEIQQSC